MLGMELREHRTGQESQVPSTETQTTSIENRVQTQYNRASLEASPELEPVQSPEDLGVSLREIAARREMRRSCLEGG